ncbi:hypothetical protein J1N35_001132 [Gossypium stocksii]|uniref:Uncharacterized protein n=1 Tax=Gossypium stocksii TaxID=47602 RepID=A0A9D4ALU0_9ROSI|nr:hypothetical protein J1N35_001132 [Gossypium stocksii]
MYVAKVKGLCALLETSGMPVSEAEQTQVILSGLSFEYEGIVSTEVPIVVNLVEGSSLSSEGTGVRGGQPPARSRGRSFQPLHVSQRTPGSPVANFTAVDGSVSSATRDVPWHTKSRAYVIDVDNS